MRETLRRCYHARLRKSTRFARSAEEKASVLADAAGGRFLFGAHAVGLRITFTVTDVAHEDRHAAHGGPNGINGPAIASFVQRHGLNDACAIGDLAPTNLNALAFKDHTCPGGSAASVGVDLMCVRLVHRDHAYLGE